MQNLLYSLNSSERGRGRRRDGVGSAMAVARRRWTRPAVAATAGRGCGGAVTSGRGGGARGEAVRRRRRAGRLELAAVTGGGESGGG
jgi:hypothetical protein